MHSLLSRRAATLLCALTAANAHAQREVVNFDFAWRYSAALEPRVQQCSQAQQGVNFGQGYIWQGRVGSYQECCNECANRQTCRAWDWHGGMCYVKDNADDSDRGSQRQHRTNQADSHCIH